MGEAYGRCWQAYKQVFVAVDKAESFADGALPAVVESNAILRLGPGHELFGRSWNEKTGDNEQSEQAQHEKPAKG